MTESARNVAVGLTVIVAMVMLGGMIVIFTGLPETLQTGYEIKIQARTTHDARSGAPVHLAGMVVGRVTDIRFTDPARPYDGVTFTARIEHDVRLAGNTRAVFFTKGFVGQAYIELKAEGPDRIDPATGRKLAFFPTDGSIIMDSMHVGSGLLPKNLEQVLENLQSGFVELAKLAKNLNDLIAPPEAPGPPPSTTAPGAPGPSTAPVAKTAGLKEMLANLNRALSGLADVFGDPASRDNVKTALANLAQAAQSAKEAMEAIKKFTADAKGSLRRVETGTSEAIAKADKRIEELVRGLVTAADKISVLMTIISKAAMKVESGDGTAGKLINDPKLYGNLVDATQQLTGLLKEFRLLVEQWKREGVKVKLK